MRIDKWLKWKVGAAVAVGIVLLFHQVKGSPLFEQAHAEHLASTQTPAAGTQQQAKDKLMDDWAAARDGGQATGHLRPHGQRQGGRTGSDNGRSRPGTDSSYTFSTPDSDGGSSQSQQPTQQMRTRSRPS